MDDLIRQIAKVWTEQVHGARYLSHEHYVSGWGAYRRDELHIAVEDGHGRSEVRVDTLRAVSYILMYPKEEIRK